MSSTTDRSTPATFTDVREDAARSWLAVPMTSTSDLSGYSWSPFCINQSLTSAVQAVSGQTGGCVVSAHRQVQLRVVGVLVVTDAVWRYDIAYRIAYRTGPLQCTGLAPGVIRHQSKHQLLDCSTQRTAADPVLNPAVRRLPAWKRKKKRGETKFTAVTINQRLYYIVLAILLLLLLLQTTNLTCRKHSFKDRLQKLLSIYK